MSTKLENLIPELSADTQAPPTRNHSLKVLRDALDKACERAETRAQTITHLQETIRIQERTIEMLNAQQTQSGALCDKYQPTLRAIEYVIDLEYALESDILTKCEKLECLYDDNGDVVGMLIRVRGQL